MVFGSGKKAQAKELKVKIEHILSLIESLVGNSAVSGETGQGAEVSAGQSALTTVNFLKESIGEMTQRLDYIVSSQQGLLGEYENFVEKCEDLDNLSRDERYQLASDFFSFVVAENAKNRKRTETLQQELAGLLERLEKLTSSMQLSAPLAGSEISNDLRKVREAVMDLASFLSVDITEPPSQDSA